jgi:hypothetical protein
VVFLLGSTWLAVNIWLSEHGSLLAAAALGAAQPGLSASQRSGS